MRVAVVDIGTNSTRLLVADVEDGTVSEVERRTTVTRLGDGVDASGRLSPEAIGRVLAAVEEYARLVARHGAERTVALATSAARDAANRDDLAGPLADRLGTAMRTIGGDEEARLTFLGATADRPGGGEPLLVIDIGGGSTEFIAGIPGEEPSFHVSTAMGSVRHTERHLDGDPPSAASLAALRADVRSIIEREVPQEVRGAVTGGIAVAGTATSLAAIEQRLDPYDPERVHGHALRAASCERMLEELAALPLAERREVTGLHPDRAPTIVAGAAILCEAMAVFGSDPLDAGERDILHGAALTAAA